MTAEMEYKEFIALDRLEKYEYIKNKIIENKEIAEDHRDTRNALEMCIFLLCERDNTENERLDSLFCLI